MNSKLLFALAYGCLSLSASVIYQQNFESVSLGAPPTGWTGSGAAVESTGGLSAFGFGSQHLRNSLTGAPTSTLTLNGLAAHSSITISFDLIVWDSMDTGKFFTVVADGSTLSGYPLDTSNYFSIDPSGFNGPGSLVSPAATGFGTPELGNNPSFRDQGRRIGNITFAHSASTLTLNFGYTANVSGGTDESWGLDNVIVSDNNVVNTSGVPEPGTFVVAAGALASLIAYRKRK